MRELLLGEYATAWAPILVDVLFGVGLWGCLERVFFLDWFSAVLVDEDHLGRGAGNHFISEKESASVRVTRGPQGSDGLANITCEVERAKQQFKFTDRLYMAKVWSAIFTLMGLFTLATASTAPAIFIFGDSLVDTGNNNYITTLSKGDIWFNGIDFGNGLPTGRFCNGRTTPDYICQIMGVPSPVPYLDPEANGKNILAGVNFASGGSGILPSTGYKYIGRIPFQRQIEYFSNTKADLISVVERAENASDLISKALFYINIGSYDYISNYFLSQSRVSQLYSVNQYQQLLLVKFAEQLKNLYEMGARKFLVSNLVPLGCTPLLISSRNPDNGSCVNYINSIITKFNKGLENMLQNELQREFSDARFVLSDNYAILSQVINNPSAFGFKYANESCCGIGRLRAEFPCTPISSLCFHRADYVFWDAFHTSDALNSMLANLQYAGSPDFVRPINIKDLMALS